MIKAVINVAAPRNQVFAVLVDYARYKEWVPHCEQCRVVSSSGNTAETTIVMNMMRRIELGVRFEAQPGQALNFRMTKGKELKSYSGTYRLMDSTDGSGTVLIAELDMDVSMPVPKFMVDKMARKTMDETGVKLRHYIQTARLPTAAPSAGPPRAAAAAPKHRRARKILRITQTGAGYNVWLMGETFAVKNPGG